MDWYYTLYIIITLTAAILLTGLICYVWYHRTIPRANTFMLMQITGWGWMVFTALEVISTDPSIMAFWNTIRFSFVAFISTTALIFILDFTGHQAWIRPPRLVLLLLFPTFILLLNWTNPLHHLIFGPYQVLYDGGFVLPIRHYGNWFWLNSLYNYLLNIVNIGFLIHAIITWKPPYRFQAGVILASLVMILVANIGFISGLIPGLSLTPVGYALACLLITWALFRYHLLKLIPVAHHTLFQHMRDGVIVLDGQQRIVEVNPAAQQFLGTSAADVIGKPASTVLPTLEIRAGELQTPVVTHIELERQHSHAPQYYDAQMTPLINHHGHLTGHIIVLRDITERKQVEETLRRSEANLARAQEIAGLASFRYNPGQDEIIWSQQLCDIIGVPQTSSIRTLNDVTRLIHPDDREQARQALTHVLQGGGTATFDVRMVRPDGTICYLQDQFEAIYDQHGTPIEIFGTIQNITRRKQDEERLKAAYDAAEAANRAKSVFLANMSHELRTPLNAILGFVDLLTRAPNMTPAQREHLDIIRHSGEHLLTLINDILDMSRIEAGRISLNTGVLDLYRLLDDLCALFQVRAQQKQLQLLIAYEPDVPQHIVTDEVKLRQVLINLLSNAIKFTSHGTIRLRASVQPTDQTGYPTLVLSVQDTGPGIPPDALEMIFEPFARAHADEQGFEGTGLGLPISRTFVELMGGTLTVQSEVGQGSTFTCTLPITPAVTGLEPAAPPVRMVQALEPDQPVYRLLIVDDQPFTRRLLVELLAPMGFEVREASNGLEALQVCDTWHPHLIWMDMRMPVMDGYTATRQIKARPHGQSIIIVALTASAFADEQAAIKSVGCDDFVCKPFHTSTIFDILHRHLGVRYRYVADPITPTLQPDLALAGIAISDGLPPDPAVPEANGTHLLPPALLTGLEEAVILGDLHLINNLVNEIEGYDRLLASRFRTLTYGFEYARMLTLIESLRGQHA